MIINLRNIKTICISFILSRKLYLTLIENKDMPSLYLVKPPTWNSFPGSGFVYQNSLEACSWNVNLQSNISNFLRFYTKRFSRYLMQYLPRKSLHEGSCLEVPGLHKSSLFWNSIFKTTFYFGYLKYFQPNF